MYLKSIEIHGFKSFANKMTFKFGKGITGIVGPNGSGKSNVADAVRWVLGEQSAKQLRGSKMEDVIFSGTESRKPLGFASVEITFDNRDHKIGVDYDEVVVSRKVFRSGESEYMLNGAICRLRDIQELFMDTGIGREGYSIIGQGQIDKVLSGKPDDRRELFDEAAGIVKYKKRKRAAEKNLEQENQNLDRVKDILYELEHRIGPLEKQDAKAREYLRLKEMLKKYDVNMYLSECDRISNACKENESKLEIVNNDLKDTQDALVATKEEYEEIEGRIGNISANIEENRAILQETLLEREHIEGEINVINEQIRSGDDQLRASDERITQINASIEEKNAEIEKIKADKESLLSELAGMGEQRKTFEEQRSFITDNIDGIKADIEIRNANIVNILNEESGINSKIARYDSMAENIDARKGELAKKLISLKSEEDSRNEIIKGFEDDLNNAAAAIDVLKNEQKDLTDRFDEIQTELADARMRLDAKQKEFHEVSSKYHTLKSVVEKYDGYGGSVKHVMERKSSTPGIEGVVADIIKVDKKYETAIEIALGGNIQNIVTDNEATAKVLIDFLKYNKFGRATFLPLTSIKNRRGGLPKGIINEKGAIDAASKLVKFDAKYADLIDYILGHILVADNIDNGLMIARKYNYGVRIVTLDGESLNAGGSMSGGAYKHSQNLLGRGRELEDLEKQIEKLKREINNISGKEVSLTNEKAEIRKREDEIKTEIQELSIAENTARLSFKQALADKDEALSSFADYAREDDELNSQMDTINISKAELQKELDECESRKKANEEEIEELNIKQAQAEEVLAEFHDKNADIITKQSVLDQNIKFADTNADRVRNEIISLKEEIESVEENKKEYILSKDTRFDEIENKKTLIKALDDKVNNYNSIIDGLVAERDGFTESNKEFFARREELTERENALDKESFRLTTALERLEALQHELSDYMWEEYELTRSSAEEIRTPELSDMSNQALKKTVNEIKASIKTLGDVNVNAIEEYKEAKERYTLLKTQHDDLVDAGRKLEGIIKSLDSAMRTQFAKKFAEIQVSFDKVFNELFGGGYGKLELVEDEDILTAGVRIIASPPGKKLSSILQMSGGEKALTAIALLFAIQRLKPSPFCLLDEIEAALDDANVRRFALYLNHLTDDIQFVIITHRRGTMNAADTLYGITMQEKGISALVSVSLIDSKLDN